MEIFIPLISGMVFIYLFFMAATYFEHRKFNYLQETSIAILVGLIVGLFLFFFSDFYQQEQSNQDTIRTVIFLVLLPPIMFEDGYNFPKRKFFQNIFYVNLYGLIGTILNFLTLWGLLTLFNNLSLFVSVSDITQAIILSNWEILMMSAAFCSIEPIVTEKVVDKARYPKLFSIMLGESLYKDTISITLFDTINTMVTKSNDPNYDIQGSDMGYLILGFLKVVIGSMLVGFIMGILTTIIFKNLRFLVKDEGISQMAMTILTGFIAYLISQYFQFSGVISMLFCGTILSHYNVYNISAVGCETTKATIQVLKMAASGLIFFFIGFEMYDIHSFESEIGDGSKSELSLSLLGFTFLALFIGRAVNIYLMSLIGILIVGATKWKLNIYEYFIIFLMGLIHGAVPFALSVTIPFLDSTSTTKALPSTNCIQLNIIFVVIISCLIFNIFVPRLIRMMLTKIRVLQITDRNHPSVTDSFLQNRDNMRIQSKFTTVDDPNTPFFKRLKSTTEKYWKKLQNGFLKPNLIYNYHERKNQIKLDKLNKRKEEHERYLKRFDINKENVLNADDEEQNMFYEVVYSNKDSGSEDSDQEDKFIIRVDRANQKAKKNKKSKQTQTEIPNIVPQTNSSSNEKRIKNAKSGSQSQNKNKNKKPQEKPSKQKNIPDLQSQKHESKGTIILTIQQRDQ